MMSDSIPNHDAMLDDPLLRDSDDDNWQDEAAADDPCAREGWEDD